MAYKRFTGIQQFDFQINRVLTYGEQACNAKEMNSISEKIHDFDSWYTSWYELGKTAEEECRNLHAAYYFRLAEFFLSEKNSEKNLVYKRCINNFYKVISEDTYVKKEFVQYNNSEMKVLVFTPDQPKDTIVMFGGYDSFIEEFYLTVKDFMNKGYKIILFEGPGQGLSLKVGLKFEYRWELPVSAILDFYNLKNISIVGISWGGYFALRAAAFEKRIKNAVAYDVLYDGFDCMTNSFPFALKIIIRLLFLLKQKGIINKMIATFMKKSIILDWAVTHGQYITGNKNAYDFFMSLKKHTLKKITKKITCNVLLLAGEKDHYIPIKHYYRLINKLKNAKSLEGKIFTQQEGGEQHCQVGNHKLATNYIIKWIDKKYKINE